MVLDTQRGEIVQRLSSSRRCSNAELALSPGSHFALFSCDEDLAHLWSLEGTPKEVATIQAELSVAALTLGDDVAVVTDGYGACKVYSVPEGKLARECSVRVDQAEVVVLAPATGAVAFISLYASAHKAWLSVGGQAKQLEAADGVGEALAFSADGALLAVANQYEVKLLDGRTGAELGKVDVAHAGGLAFSADGSKLAVSTGGEDAAVKFVDVASRTVTSSVPIRWKRGLFGFETDDAGALAFEGNESVLFLTKWRGVLLRVRPK